jgi:hypothetical protein
MAYGGSLPAVAHVALLRMKARYSFFQFFHRGTLATSRENVAGQHCCLGQFSTQFGGFDRKLNGSAQVNSIIALGVTMMFIVSIAPET